MTEQAPHQTYQGQPGRHRQCGISVALLQREFGRSRHKCSNKSQLEVPRGWYESPSHTWTACLPIRRTAPRNLEATAKTASRRSRASRYRSCRIQSGIPYPRRFALGAEEHVRSRDSQGNSRSCIGSTPIHSEKIRALPCARSFSYLCFFSVRFL